MSSVTYASLGLPFAKPWTNKYQLEVNKDLGIQKTVGSIQDLLPILGTPTKILYLDEEYKVASMSEYFLGFGSGARFMEAIGKNNEIIVGGFADATYQKTIEASTWYFNPGLELFTINQNIIAQFYYPFTAKQIYASTLASNMPSTIDNQNEIDQYTSRIGHNIFDTEGQLVQEFARGFEVELDQYEPIFLNTWFSIGGYYFDFPSAQAITGVEVNLELRMVYNQEDDFAINVQENYDSQDHNQVTLGLIYRFGGHHDEHYHKLANRMEEIPNHHIARPGHAIVAPSSSVFVPSGIPQSIVSSSNWYFSATGTDQGTNISLANCTNENPCKTLTQDIADGIQTINPNASLYFSTGTYNLPNNPNVNNASVVLMNDGQKIFGRTLNWESTATGSARPLINGALFWGDNSGNVTKRNSSGSIDSMQINNSNVLIPASVSGFNSTSIAAIALGATNKLTINNTAITAFSNTAASQAIGSWTLNGALNVTSSSVSATAAGNGIVSSNEYYAYGLHSQNGAINLTDSTVSVSTDGAHTKSIGVLTAIDSISIENSTITAQTTGSNADVHGVSAVSSGVSMTNSSIQASATNNNAVVRGIYAPNSASGTITLDKSSVSATSSGTGGVATGIDAALFTLNFINSQSDILAAAATAAAINATTVHNNSSPKSTCTTNGTTVDCS